MTTPDLPQAAIKAAAEVLQRAEANDDAPNPVTTDIAWWCRDVAADMLAAALPMLGEIPAVAGEWVSIPADQARTEYAVHCPEHDRCIPALSKSAAIDMTGWHGCQGEHKIVTRIAGEWTEAPSE